ncbi:endoplasmic reticulum protein SC65-like [Brienomyrus brachyistius]|uniref:endoplasmic reticulum protein SC65-like n=1 Tax=Brienomyrus brachyistius TaxID=42636 RepID=UPI0020B2B072|nr:endoplasmic reticulum protein SC65-like [Brienomyrus brachyistius]XP_048886965.1 endoplasmic reticulum protein SC65-like [Brienomyrus brachyistius]
MAPDAGCAKLIPLLLSLWMVLLRPGEAQYEKYSFKSFPQNDIMPLETAYAYALDQYAAQNWRESLKFLGLSLRLHRLLKDCDAFCSQNCSSVSREHDALFTDSTLQLVRHVLLRASCLKKCKANFPVFTVSYPRRDVLDAFEKRIPYRYIQYAQFQIDNLEKAVSAAHTFLQKNPGDPQITKNMNYYRTLFDVEEYLIDHEERPYEGLFLKAVKLFNAGDFSSSARHMEQAASEYFAAFGLCLAGCEGAYEVTQLKDFFPSLAALYTDVLRCKAKCEANLTPNVGGFFVEKFAATMYHYLQFAYYKLNDVRNAAPCAASYTLFDPGDETMKQNMVYYHFYREQWGLDEIHFKPRPEAVRYFNQTTLMKDMLEFAEKFLQPDDEDVVSPEEPTSKVTDPPDAEFEGLGDYEESFVADWWQEPKSKGDVGEPSE